MSKQKNTQQGKQPLKTSRPSANKNDSAFDLNKYLEGKALYVLSAIVILGSLFVYNDFIFGKSLFIYKDIGSDTYNQFVPSLVHFSNYLRTDGIPKWSFNQGMGQNIFPGGLNDPFNVFVYLFDANNIYYAIVYAQLLKILLAGIVFYYYLRTLGSSLYASLTGAILFSFSGYMIVGGCWYGHASYILNLAFLLFAFEKLYKQNLWIYFPIAVALISAEGFILYIVTFFLLVYSLLRYYSENKFNSTGILRLFLKMIGLGLLGFAINAVFIISPLLQALNSPRVSGEAGYFNVLRSAPMFGLATVEQYMTVILRSFSSDLQGTGSDYKGWYNYLEAPIFYTGLVTLLLIPQVFQFLDKKRKIILASFLGFWMFLILFPYFRHALYLFAGDYYKSGMSVFVSLTLLFTGITALSNIDKLNKINVKVLLLTFVALMIFLFYPYLPSGEKYIDANLRNVVVVFLILYALFISLLGNIKTKGFSQVMILLCITIEVSYFSHISTTNHRITESKNELQQKTGYNDYTVDAVNYIKSIDKSFYRINKNYFSGTAIHGSLNDALIQDYYSTPSYQSFNQRYYIRFLSETNAIQGSNESETRWSKGLLYRPFLQTMANIKYTLTNDTKGFYGLNDSIAMFGDVIVLKNKYYLPFGCTYDSITYLKDFLKISDLQKDKALLKSIVIDENQKEPFKDFPALNLKDTSTILTFDEYRKSTDALRKDTLQISEHSQNMFIGKIRLEKKKILLFSIPFDNGWKASVDGKDMIPILLDIGFIGLVLEKGEHEVELHYNPPYLKETTWLSALSLMLYCGGIIVWVLRKRRQK